MKKLLTLTLLLIAVNGYSQKNGFLRPVPNDLFELDITTDRDITSDYVPSKWLVRPIVTISAMQFNFTKPVTTNTLSSLGTGISYQHFILQNGKPYANYGINLLFLFGQESYCPSGDDCGVYVSQLSIALTGMLWQYINVGIGYNIPEKMPFILTGVSYSFN